MNGNMITSLRNFISADNYDDIRENFLSFLREKTDLFSEQEDIITIREERYNHRFDPNINRVGFINLTGYDKIPLYFIPVNELNERASRKMQFNLGKDLLREDLSAVAGIFIFYDSTQRKRVSYIEKIYQGGRTQFSSFRRYTFYISPDQTNKTFIQQFSLGDFNSLNGIKDVFSVEKVTEEFFEAYKYALKEIIIKSLDNRVDDRKKFSFAQQLLSRIMFVYFIQRKGWLKWKNYQQDKKYLSNLWKKYKQISTKNDTFYSHWLSSLFFGAFNKKNELINNELPKEIRESYIQMPFLNGGLFSKNELDELFPFVPDSVFEWLFEIDETNKNKGFLETFNFTVSESTYDDFEVAVDPEMLGIVYESLISEEERGKDGIFYTHRTEIDLMCRLSLVNWLHSQTSIDKNVLIDLIFNPESIYEYNKLEDLCNIRSKLEKCKIVDPSAGSASFLVGMMNILVEILSILIKKIEGKEVNLFALKHKIILENLFGVDVKDWAVMVGELRLWLSLIIETDEKYMDIYTRPLLPNLSFKIRQGDALVEEVGGIFINLRGNALKNISPQIHTKIRHLIDRKSDFFSGKISANIREQQEIEKLETDIFKEILQYKIDELKYEIQQKSKSLDDLKKQKNLFGEKSANKKDIKEKENQIQHLNILKEKYETAQANLQKKSKKEYFLWELDFAEVFALNAGFDIVIGNPPYVRQELIAPPLENEKDYKPDEWRELKKQYKDKLIQATQNVWDVVKKIDKKSDLYVFFYYQGLSLLNNNGIFCFINSNSWLDVGYGTGLQEFLLKNMKPLYIIDNIAKRSFKQADVNTVIVLIQKPETKPDNFTLKFVAFKKPFEEAITPEILREIEQTNKPIFDNPIYRIYPKTRKELLEEGVEYPEETELKLEHSIESLPYIGNKWGGKYLRAPEIYFKILEKGKDKLVRLGDIAEVRRGFTTGANEFFYLKPVGLTVKQVVEIAEKNPQALIRVKNGAGWEGEIEAEFLKPFLFSLKEVEKYSIDLNKIERLIFMGKSINKNSKSCDYIKYGEKNSFHKRPTTRNRIKWYEVPEQKYPDFASNRFLGERFGFPINNECYICDVFFVGYFANLNKEIGTLLINSTISYLGLEVISRKTYGIGVAYIYGPEINNLILLNPCLISENVKNKLESISKSFLKRNIFSIYSEFGFDPNLPIREQEPNPFPDRKELDDIVFDALGLTEEERKEVYWAVAELVKARLDKARSV
ncbi:MAG: hypothetical protein KatS3mg027_0449 [Bacteroidia bacterium]|nr:MAG: hypothetical protein KatS3mg027_0449 [Bacteroidia bacterium]